MAFDMENASSTFQGQDQQGQSNQPARPKCRCGSTTPWHCIARCSYITKKAKEGWEPRPGVMEKVAKALRNPKVQVMVNKEIAARYAAIRAKKGKEGGYASMKESIAAKRSPDEH